MELCAPKLEHILIWRAEQWPSFDTCSSLWLQHLALLSRDWRGLWSVTNLNEWPNRYVWNLFTPKTKKGPLFPIESNCILTLTMIWRHRQLVSLFHLASHGPALPQSCRQRHHMLRSTSIPGLNAPVTVKKWATHFWCFECLLILVPCASVSSNLFAAACRVGQGWLKFAV